MKVIRLDDFGTKTPSGKLPDGSRKKKKKPAATDWTLAESAESTPAKNTESATPTERGPTYSEIMQKYYAGQYADALAGNKRTAEAEASAAELDAQDALERIRGGYKSTDRQLYREYMESKRTLPQRLAAQGITGGLTESSQVRLANSYGEELAENERARLAEEAKTYSARDARLAAARAEQSRADAEAKRTHGESLAKLWQEAEKHRREDAAKTAALLAAAGDYSGYVGMGLTQEQADYLAEIWMGRNGALASLRRARNAGNAGNSGSGSSLADTLSESLLIKAERGADAAVEYIAAQLASGAIRSDEAEEIWKLLRASGESDI
mgnify:CR=1 FL=1